jgi:hypothetical protein
MTLASRYASPSEAAVKSWSSEAAKLEFLLSGSAMITQLLVTVTVPATVDAEVEPDIHRVDPESGSTLRLLSEFLVKLPAWVNLRNILGQPCDV